MSSLKSWYSSVSFVAHRRWHAALTGGWMIAALVSGCPANHYFGDEELAVEDPSAEDPPPEEPPPANPATCICTPVAPFGFDGPSLVGRAAKLSDIHCPPEASLPGFAGQLIDTSEWARECRITPLPTCSESGWVCAPPPPRGFSLCIYRDEEFACPDDYADEESALESNGGMLSADAPVTLCCAVQTETP